MIGTKSIDRAGLYLILILLLSIISAGNGRTEILFSQGPVWSVGEGTWAVAPAWGDFNKDGWLDLYIGGGGDVEAMPDYIYFGSDTGLSTEPDWVSDYQGMSCIVNVSDLNNDGYPDVIVPDIGGGSSRIPKPQSIYFNQGGYFNTTPDWSSIPMASWATVVGDVDMDGDLDIVFPDDAYDQKSTLKLFINNGGTFNTAPDWESDDTYGFTGGCFSDVDMDGDLDLAMNGGAMGVKLFYNNNGVLETTPSWESVDVFGGSGVSFGDMDGDGDPDMAASSFNGFEFVIFINHGGTFNIIPEYRFPNDSRLSHVSWGDADGDNDLDLCLVEQSDAFCIYENIDGVLTETPQWCHAPGLYPQINGWGDYDNDGLTDTTETFTGDGTRKLFALSKMNLHALTGISIDGEPLELSEYCCSLVEGRVSTSPTPGAGSTIEVSYTFSRDLDLVGGTMGTYLYENFAELQAGDTLRVPSEYNTIQDAIDAAQDADVVLVADGIYTGPGFRDISFGTKIIHVVSENGPEYAVIDCQGSEADPHRVFTVENNGSAFASIEGFTIKGGASVGTGSAIHLINSYIRILNCAITNNYSDGGGAVHCVGSSPTISNCTVSINDCAGIYIDESSAPLIKNSIIWENIPDEIISLDGSDPEVRYCDIHGFFWPSDNCISSNPFFADPYNDDFRTFESSVCIDGGDPTERDPDDSRVDMGIYCEDHPAFFDAGGTIHVDPTGNDETGDGSSRNPFQTIRQGLRASRHGDTVIVENGIYSENIDFYGHLTYLTSRYYLTGNITDISATIIDGQGTGSVVTFIGEEDDRATVNGFTIQNGFALNGGGISCSYSDPNITHNYIVNNTVDQYGAGIYNVYSSSEIRGCLISGNDAPGNFGFGGGIYIAYGAPKIINCTSVGNSSYSLGGSIYSYSSDMQVVNTISRMNSSGYKPELYISGGDPVVIYSDIEGSFTGEGNIDEDPMFCDASSADYSLHSASPCIYGGINETMIGAFGPGCGEPVAALSVEPYEINPAEPGNPGVEREFSLRFTNVGNVPITIDNIESIEIGDSVSGWLALGDLPSLPIPSSYPDNYFDLEVIVNAGGIVDIPYVPMILEGYLQIAWEDRETQIDITYEVGSGGFVCDCVPGECDGIAPLNILDIIHLINYEFMECPPGAGENTCAAPSPYPVCSGDANCDCTMNILDITYLIQYKFQECPEGAGARTCPPPCTCEEWVLGCGAEIH